MMAQWTSPDGKIKKIVQKQGIFGKQPSEESRCTIFLTDYSNPNLEIYSSSTLVIGDNDGDIGRCLDICLTTMNEGEISRFTLFLDTDISFTIELAKLESEVYIYKFGAKRKYDLANYHKEKGITLFRLGKNKDAAYRFTKAVKIVSSIPINVQDNPSTVEGVSTDNIKKMKVNLFNNLSSCYFKNESWELVIELCEKVISFDKENIKALYKVGVAYEKCKDFEKAEVALKKVLDLEPDNKAAKDHYGRVKVQLKNANQKYNALVKKMFDNTLN